MKNFETPFYALGTLNSAKQYLQVNKTEQNGLYVYRVFELMSHEAPHSIHPDLVGFIELPYLIENIKLVEEKFDEIGFDEDQYFLLKTIKETLSNCAEDFEMNNENIEPGEQIGWSTVNAFNETIQIDFEELDFINYYRIVTECYLGKSDCYKKYGEEKMYITEDNNQKDFIACNIEYTFSKEIYKTKEEAEIAIEKIQGE